MRLRLDLRNDMAELEAAVGALESALGEAGIPFALVHDVRLISEEVLTNAICHGCDPDTAHAIAIDARFEEDRLRLEFRDDGPEFDPLARELPDVDAGIDERPIGGLGVFLVRELAESVSYERAGGFNVLRVVLRLPG
jgi:anti-sigma regulatory factor (Ser/Thr protein kinase)